MTGNPDQPDNPTTATTPGAPDASEATTRLEQVWSAVIGELQTHQRAWVQYSQPVTMHGTTAIVAVPDDFTRKRLEGRMRTELEEALSSRFGHEVQLAVTVDSTLDHPAGYESTPTVEPSGHLTSIDRQDDMSTIAGQATDLRPPAAGQSVDGMPPPGQATDGLLPAEQPAPDRRSPSAMEPGPTRSSSSAVRRRASRAGERLAVMPDPIRPTRWDSDVVLMELLGGAGAVTVWWAGQGREGSSAARRSAASSAGSTSRRRTSGWP